MPFETALFFIVIIYVFQNGAMKLGREHHHSGVEEPITIARQAPIAIVFLGRIVDHGSGPKLESAFQKRQVRKSQVLDSANFVNGTPTVMSGAQALLNIMSESSHTILS